jgi:flagella basal body P-ring formation protein FlgA
MITALIILAISLQAQTVTVPVAEIRQAAEQYIRSSLGLPQEDVMVEFRGESAPVTVPGTHYTVRIADGLPGHLSGHVTIPMEILTAGNISRRILISLRVRTFGDVLVAVRRLDRHTAIGATDVAVRHVETTLLSRDLLRRPEEVIGKRTSKMIAEGEVLAGRMCEPSPVIRQQSTVDLVAKSGSIRISTRAVALEDGCAGGMITVKKIGSNVKVSAKVLDENTVEVGTE